MSIKQIAIGAIIGALILFIVLLAVGASNKPLGNISNPYNADLGYQGIGYYNNNGTKFYTLNISQFNSKVSSITSTIYNTTSISTTTQQTTITSVSTSTIQTTNGYTTTLYKYEVGQFTNIPDVSIYEISNGQVWLNESGISYGSYCGAYEICGPYQIGQGTNIAGVTIANITDGFVWLSESLPSTSSYYTTSIPQSYYTTTVPPMSTHNVQNGNFTFTFTLLSGSLDTWTFPIATYNQYETAPRIAPIIRVNDSGKTVFTYDYRSLVTPSFFKNVVPSLTNGESALQFVDQVKNIKNQLTSYSTVFYNTSVYPVEVLGSGEGDCKDLGVLMASILEAGNMEAGYGMNISFEYVDAYNLTDPQTVNHLILYITFANGTSEYLDTTNVLPNTSTIDVTGWRFPLICNATSCQTTPICSGGYCDAVGYAPNGASNYDTCSVAGDVVGYDNLCHSECGGANYYCNSGYSCDYNNECAG